MPTHALFKLQALCMLYHTSEHTLRLLKPALQLPTVQTQRHTDSFMLTCCVAERVEPAAACPCLFGIVIKLIKGAMVLLGAAGCRASQKAVMAECARKVRGR